MAAPVPNQIPDSIAAGDTLKFQISLTDYQPGDGWVLTYNFLQISTGIALPVFTSTASGTYFLITVTAAVTCVWEAGEYQGQAYVTLGAERHQVWQGKLTVLHNFATESGMDLRTKARKILDFIDCSFEKVVQKQAVRATIEGVQFEFRNLEELQKARNYWAAVVNGEDASAQGKPRRNLFAMFTRPQSTLVTIPEFGNL